MRCFIYLFAFVISSHLAWSQSASLRDFEKPPKEAWTFNTKGPIISSPLLVDEMVVLGGLDSNVYALDLHTGKLLWKYKTNGPIRSTPVAYEQSIFIYAGDGVLYCFTKEGKSKWTFQTIGEKTYELFSYADYFHSTPIVDSGILLFGSGDTHVYAVSASDGKQLWKYKTEGIVHATGSIDKENFYIGSFDGHAYALNKKDGTPIWKFKSVGQQYFPRGEMQGNALAWGNTVFIGSRDYNLYALDTKKGHGLWNKQFSKGWAMGNPFIRDSILYVGTSDDMVLLALNPKTGTTKWKANIHFNVFGGPALGKTMAYIGTLMGRLYAINLSDGSIRWSYDLPAFLKNKTIYFKDDLTYRDDIQTVIQKGEDFLSMYYNLGAIFSTPVIKDQYLVFTSTDGKIYCLLNSTL
jgi:eukaryotic-like serine/threonine-protein kinase